MARPTLYGITTPAKVDEYISTTGREQTELPTIEGLAIYLKVHVDTINEWEKQYPEFSVAVKSIRERQKSQLINDGLYGGKEVNQAMAIFLLKANHNMVETSHLDLTSQGEKLAGPIVFIPKEDEQ